MFDYKQVVDKKQVQQAVNSQTDESDIFVEDITPTVKPSGSQFNKRDEKWNNKKTASLHISARLGQINLPKRAERVKFCAEDIFSGRCPNCNNEYVTQVNFCRDRVCPVCNWRRARRLALVLQDRIDYCTREYGISRYILLTLSTPNVAWSELKPEIKKLLKAWNLFYKRLNHENTVTGWSRTLEITRGRDGLANHHLHVLLQVPPEYFTREGKGKPDLQYYSIWRLLVMWADCTKLSVKWPDNTAVTSHGIKMDGVDYTWQQYADGVKYGDPRWQAMQDTFATLERSVDVRAVRGTGGDHWDVLSAIREVAKYTTKHTDIDDMDDDDFLHYVQAVKGVRLWATGGRLKITEAQIERLLIDYAEEAAHHHGICGECGGLLQKIHRKWSAEAGEYRVWWAEDDPHYAGRDPPPG
jgi:plasmid rolling circle replication initiator protein Rep